MKKYKHGRSDVLFRQFIVCYAKELGIKLSEEQLAEIIYGIRFRIEDSLDAEIHNALAEFVS